VAGPAVLAPGHRLVPDVVGHVGKIDSAAALPELRQQAWSIRTLHESVTHAGAPEARGLLRNGHAFCLGAMYPQLSKKCVFLTELADPACRANDQRWSRKQLQATPKTCLNAPQANDYPWPFEFIAITDIPRTLRSATILAAAEKNFLKWGVSRWAARAASLS
jgi:hypothetical protein